MNVYVYLCLCVCLNTQRRLDSRTQGRHSREAHRYAITPAPRHAIEAAMLESTEHQLEIAWSLMGFKSYETLRAAVSRYFWRTSCAACTSQKLSENKGDGAYMTKERRDATPELPVCGVRRLEAHVAHPATSATSARASFTPLTLLVGAAFVLLALLLCLYADKADGANHALPSKGPSCDVGMPLGERLRLVTWLRYGDARKRNR